MSRDTLSLVAADLVLITHVLFVVFVVLGLVLILVGRRRWSWVRNPWFRIAHIAAIAVVAVQSWFGVVCPLTTLEMALRRQAGAEVYGGAFIAHWLDKILFYNAPPWVFTCCYTMFGVLVAASWLLVRPTGFGVGRQSPERG